MSMFAETFNHEPGDAFTTSEKIYFGLFKRVIDVHDGQLAIR